MGYTNVRDYAEGKRGWMGPDCRPKALNGSAEPQEHLSEGLASTIYCRHRHRTPYTLRFLRTVLK
jgi:hypothetical protein